MATLEQLFRQRAKIDMQIRKKQRMKRKRSMKPRMKKKGTISSLISDIQRIRKERKERMRQEQFNKARAIKRVRESELPEERKEQAISGLRETEARRFKSNEPN